MGSSAHVASPTFQLVRVYAGRVQIAHVDLYRLEDSADLADLGLDELLDQGAVVVEWGDRLEAPEAALLSIEHLGGDRRHLRAGARAAQLIFVIDTSSARSALALIRSGWHGGRRRDARVRPHASTSPLDFER